MGNVAKKLLLFGFIIFLLIQKISQASIGLGIWPSEINVNVSPFRRTLIYLFVFNPSNKSIGIEIESECIDCSRDIISKGRKIGEAFYSLKLKTYPQTLKLERDKNASYPILISVSPSFILEKKVVLYYPVKTSFKLPSLLVGKKSFTIRTSVTSKEGRTRISVTSFAHLTFNGVNKLLLTSLLVLVLILIVFLLRRFLSPS